MKCIQSLLNPTIYPHRVTRVELLETHISWVILTGGFAYKIKKPVNFGFLDFSTLEKRRFYCNEELRLNKRLAPQIYLETVAINGSEDTPHIDGPGPTVDYAVKMREFRQQDQFDRLLANKQLNTHDIVDLAHIIARFHQTTQRAPPDSQFGDPQHVFAPVQENFTQIGALIESDQERTLLTSIATWSQSEFERLHAVFTERKQLGFVRECHGDMHLRNIAKFQNAIVIFDCIEFNDNLRWIDVISEIAFAEMDLHDRGRGDFANILLNTYLQNTGDYYALRLLRYYLVYRAMVRAKVDCIRAHQADIGPEEQAKTTTEYRRYLDLAQQFTQPDRPFLLITCGLSGCGKTYTTDRLMAQLPFIRLRSDVERKRLFGLASDESSSSALDGGIYSQEASQQTYARLVNLTRQLLACRCSVLVDAAFLKIHQRQEFRRIAEDLNVPFLILHFHAPDSVLFERVERRAQQQVDASEADRQVLEAQITRQEPPSAADLSYTLKIDSSATIEYSNLAQRILYKLSHSDIR